MKQYELREQMNSIEEPPRKTWFWELGAAVIDADRCVQCGICVAVCPSNSIGVQALTNVPELVKMCTGCSLCWDFCPRAGLRYEATWHEPEVPEEPVARGSSAPVGLATGAQGSGSANGTSNGLGRSTGHRTDDKAPWQITGTNRDPGLGAVIESYAVRAASPIRRTQDGGAVSALLVGLLSAGVIDGALVSKPSASPDEPWKGIPTIARTPGEVYAAAGSFYNQTMGLAGLDLAGLSLPDRPRIAVVGTPCEVEGLRAMQLRPWPTGAHRVDAVTLTIALLCTKSFDYEALIIEELQRKRDIDLERVDKIDVTRGRLIVRYADGAIAVDESIKQFHGAALKGCAECSDFLGRAADISLGSVGSIDGWTSAIVRTERGRAAFDRARAKLDVRGLDDVDALLRLDLLNKRIAEGALRRPLDPRGPMFIDFESHVRTHGAAVRQPVALRS